MTFIVYKLTSPSGKVYIGYTSKTLQKRLSVHNYDRNRLIKLNKPLARFYSAIAKYPLDQWSAEILHLVDNKVQAYQLEIKEIAIHQSQNSKFGYNTARGGIGGDTGTNSRISKRQQHSLFMKQFLIDNPSLAIDRSIKAQHTLQNNPEKFKKQCEYRASKLLRGKQHQNHTGAWVVNHAQYDCLRDAVILSGISESTIVKLCNQPDRVYLNSSRYCKKGNTPRQMGFYRILNEESNNV